MDQTTSKIAQYISEKQVADDLAVSKALLRKWRRTGGGPQFTRLGRCVRYSVSSVEEFLAKHSSK
jgi:hypothetical protein